MTLAVSEDLLQQGHVRVAVDEVGSCSVLSVTLDRPDARNAQTPSTWAALTAIGDAVERSAVDLVVIRGAGSAFSAGLDRRMFTPEGIPGETSLAAMAAQSDEAMAAQIEVYQRAFAWQRQVSAVTVAAVHGPAIGAGFQLALACDLLVATPEAGFAMRETSYGLVPDLGGTLPLVQAAGYARAVEMCASGRLVSAEEGYRLGFVTRVVDDLDAEIDQLRGVVAAAPAGAIRDLLPLLAGAEHASRAEQFAAERWAQVGRLRSLLGGG